MRIRETLGLAAAVAVSFAVTPLHAQQSVGTRAEPVQVTPSGDFHFFEEIHEVLQMEPNEALDPESLGLFAAVGLEKGKPFAPDMRMKKILIEAAAVGNATARSLTFRSRTAANYIYPDSVWWIPSNSGFDFLLQPGVFDLDNRTAFHYWATGITPAMFAKFVGRGSQYAGLEHALSSLRSPRSRGSTRLGVSVRWRWSAENTGGIGSMPEGYELELCHAFGPTARWCIIGTLDIPRQLQKQRESVGQAKQNRLEFCP